MADPEFRPKWIFRRATIFATLIFSALVISSAMVGWYLGLEINAPLSAVLVAIVVMDTSIIAAYVFNATFEDIKLGLSR